jgi:hypothetical protein
MMGKGLLCAIVLQARVVLAGKKEVAVKSTFLYILL